MAHGFKGHELWLAALVVGVDQATKGLVRGHFQLGESVSVIDGFFDIARVHNTGTAFGFMNGVDFPLKSLVLAGIAYWKGWFTFSSTDADGKSKLTLEVDNEKAAHDLAGIETWARGKLDALKAKGAKV